MSRLILITGFLGAGKTTFLKELIKVLADSKLHLIINEFGKEGVDGELLREVGTVLDEINNGSIFCSCRLDKFEEVLQSALIQQPDIIVVEASGLSNPLNVKKILGQKDKFSEVEYEGSICIIDGKQFHKVYETASVVKKQLAVSDLFLINKTDLISKEQTKEIEKVLNSHRPDVPIYYTTFGKIQKEWLTTMKKQEDIQEDLFQSMDITLRKYTLYLSEQVDLYSLQKFLEMFIENTYRVKGFVNTNQGRYLINCVGNMFEAQPYLKVPTQEDYLVVLSGVGLPTKKEIKKAMEWYPHMVKDFL
ncbi:cobalamin biosynthesis protein CobW [Sporanaerobium hydrogeniformans]|uniref:Cobalamin biosynthesis protein CobW n=1 Tax=Sporanaerobium hydrogeniformans TaxID=3072179 RepID=A0AC61DA29_9FIRM|nr:CobW family GTP-binding protein [Sporanaerobium hydrogeniformans]PHV69903.1 cobalamin biosynthesis protein CobW [Sporanaerobium hydrogeniformans]